MFVKREEHEMNYNNEAIEKAINHLGFEAFTEIQEKTIPLILKGQDVIGHSQTGTGKTAAFAIPILERIDVNNPSVQAIIICPTRELAMQVKEAFDTFARFMHNLKTIAVYGGEPMHKQVKALKRKPQIIIGTPGRTIDHINRRLIKLKDVKHVVLDEADEMLKMGFKEDIELILSQTPKTRQTIMFSATMPKPILALSKTYMQDPVHITVVPKEQSNKNITQYFYQVKEQNKLEALNRLYHTYNPKLSLVFCNTKRKVDELTDLLKDYNIEADKIHGDLPQTKRIEIIKRFHQGRLKMLIATDVAARGLDIKNVEAVFNYDIPEKADHYVHRIGRTGRVNNKGYAFSFATKKELKRIDTIKAMTHSTMKKRNIPTAEKIEILKNEVMVQDLTDTIAEHKHEKFINDAKKILEQHNPTEVVAALLASKQENLPIENTDINESFTHSKTSQSSNKNAITYQLNLGKKMGLTPKKLVDMIKEKTKLNDQGIQDVKVRKTSASFSIDKKNKKLVERSIKRLSFKGRHITVSLAN